MVVFLKRKLINFDDSEVEKFEKMAEDLGFDSFSSFAKASMLFNYQFKSRFFDMFEKVDSIFLKLDEVNQNTVSSANVMSEVSLKLDSYEEKLKNLPTDSEFLQIRLSLYEVLRQNADGKWISYSDIKKLMGIENNLTAIKILQHLLDSDFEVKSLVERRKDLFRIRKEALPMEPYEIITRD